MAYVFRLLVVMPKGVPTPKHPKIPHVNTLAGIRSKHGPFSSHMPTLWMVLGANMGPLSDFVDVKHHVEFCEGIEWLHLSFLKWNPIHQQE